MLKLIFAGLLVAGLFISSLFVSHPQVQVSMDYTPAFGAYAPTGGGTYRLGSSIGTSDTTIKLSSFKEPVSNTPYTMSYLNSDIEYGTLSPQSSVSEFISFTGITQNGDGSALLTGVKRGLSRTPAGAGCVASTTLAQSHAGQSIFIISNSPCFYSEYAPLRTNATSSAVLTFSSTSPPRLDYSAAQSTGTYIATTSEFATINYVNAIALAGVQNATAAVKGILQLATRFQVASSTALGTTGASLSIPTSMATDTPQNCSTPATGGCVVVSDLGGHIKQAWINLSDNFTWLGMHTFSNLFATNASSTNATTTNLTVTGNSIGITGKLNLNTSPNQPTGAATTSVVAFTVPANTLSTSNYIESTIYVNSMRYHQAQCTSMNIEVGYGYASTTIPLSVADGASNLDIDTGAGVIKAILSATGVTNTQKLTLFIQTNASTTPIGISTTTQAMKSTTLAINSTAAQNFGINVQTATGGGTGCSMTIDQTTTEIYH